MQYFPSSQWGEPFVEVGARLRSDVDVAEARLRALSEQEASEPRETGKWSPKEILGHLVDSASNNHQRFVRAQQGDYTGPAYDQEFWVSSQGYQNAPWPELVELWRLYNRHLARVIERVLPESLDTECRVGHYAPATLGFIIEDYLAHLQHHLHQIHALEAHRTQRGSAEQSTP